MVEKKLTYLIPLSRLPTGLKLSLARIASNIVSIFSWLHPTGSTRVVSRRGVLWDLNLNEGIDLSIFLLGAFEGHTIRRYENLILRVSDPVIMDIGANCGSHALPLALLASKRSRYGRVIAIEPAANAFDRLTRNASLNPSLSPVLQCLQAFISSSSDDTLPNETFASWPLRERPRNSLHPVHQGALHRTTGALVTTIDEIVRQQGIDHVDLIKIDVDGMEHLVLRGARQVIDTLRPTLVLEWSPHEIEKSGGALVEEVAWILSRSYVILNLSDMASLPGGVPTLNSLCPFYGSVNIAIMPISKFSQIKNTL